MGYYINVDSNKLKSTVSIINQYISNHKSKMYQSSTTVNVLANQWIGSDSEQFKSKWEDLFQRGSTSDKMIEALENYKNYLDYAAEQYNRAQSNAISRANNLPRW